jgi:hypothetical protein
MSWWDIGGGYIIGDAPLDTVRRGLSSLARQRAAASRAKPTLSQLLTAVAAELHVVEPRQLELVVHDGNGPNIVVDETGESVDRDVAALARELLTDVEHIYQEAWSRPSRTEEVLAALSVVLGAAPEKFLADGDDLDLLRIEARYQRSRES